MRHGTGGRTGRLAAILLVVLPLCVHAQFDPARIAAEPAGVAARFADPGVTYATPGFRPGLTGFPTHDDVLAFTRTLAERAPAHVHVEAIGASQQGRMMPLVVLSGAGGMSAARPTVLVLAQQHGNEPAGGEAALALAERLAGAEAALLDRVNVLIVPRANPDGAERFARTTVRGADVNRDPLLLQ
ncbi:MAG: peptidase M14, partial [Acidobacteria bacterium]|nr:peptidase M14 [Acidobacteriota bacterium]